MAKIGTREDDSWDSVRQAESVKALYFSINDGALISIAEVAGELQCSATTIRRMIRAVRLKTNLELRIISTSNRSLPF